MLNHLPPEFREVMKRYMGGGQGDSSGEDATSSSDSDGGALLPDDRVGKLLIRRNNFRFMRPLKDQCLDFIIKNQTSMTKNLKKQFKYIASKHPTVLDFIMDAIKPINITDTFIMFDRSYPMQGFYDKEFVKLLLHRKSSVFYLELLREEDIDEGIWSFLVNKCPNLEKIIWHHNCCETQLPLKYLLQMKNLEHIQLNNFVCDDTAMEKIAMKFPNLKFLDVKFYKLSAKGMQSLLRLKKLEQIHFSIKTNGKVSEEKLKTYNTQFMEMCLSNLPMLKELTNYNAKIVLDIQDALGKFHKSKPGTTLSLEKIFLDKHLNIPPSSLPEVEAIHIIGPLKCVKDLTKFKKLHKLDFYVAASEHVNFILKKIGRQLNSLRITNEFYSTDVIDRSDIFYDFFTIFHYCPNLEKFCFKGVKFCEDPDMTVSAANFKNLVRVDISLFDMQGYQMPLAIVEHILRAQKLEDLAIYWAKCFPRALVNVLSNDKNRQYLQNLKRLSAQRIWVRNTKGYIKQLKKVIYHAPKLEKLEVICRDHDVKDFKTSGLKEMCNRIPGLSFLTDYDDGVGPRDPATYLEVHGFTMNIQELMGNK